MVSQKTFRSFLLAVLCLVTFVGIARADSGPAYEGAFQYQGDPVPVLPPMENGDVLMAKLSISEQFEDKDQQATFDKSLLKNLRAEIALKNEKGKMVARVWLQDGQEIDLGAYRKKLGKKLSVSLEQIKYDFDVDGCKTIVKGISYFNSDMCNRFTRKDGALINGQIQLTTRKDQLSAAIDALPRAFDDVADKSNNGANPAVQDDLDKGWFSAHEPAVGRLPAETADTAAWLAI